MLQKLEPRKSFPFTYRRALVSNDQAVACLNLIFEDGVERLRLRVVAAGRANKSGNALARELDHGATGAQGSLKRRENRGGEEVSILRQVHKRVRGSILSFHGSSDAALWPQCHATLTDQVHLKKKIEQKSRTI